jgi:hypothetical protein
MTKSDGEVNAARIVNPGEEYKLTEHEYAVRKSLLARRTHGFWFFVPCFRLVTVE